jgi:hypothetical protein
MKTRTLLGIRLISTGIAALATQGIRYRVSETDGIDFTSRDILPVRRVDVPLLPIVGALSLVGGILMLFFGKKEL